MLPLVLGGIGAAGGALGGGALAGRYMPFLGKAAYEGADYLRSKASSGLRKAANTVAGVDYEGAGLGALGTPARALQARLGQASRAAGNLPLGAVPGIASATGLGMGAVAGGLAGGALGGGIGQLIDPESPGSSNTASAKYGVTPYATTMQYV